VFCEYDDSALSDVQKIAKIKLLVDSLIRWDKLSKHYPFAVEETNQHGLGFSWGGVSLEISISSSAHFSQCHTT
jgi:hypothetical protein